MFALEVLHEGYQCGYGFHGDGVVEGDAHAAYRAMPGGAYHAGLCGGIAEFFLEGFVAAVLAYAEDYVHF